jgi:prophage DNA circulation protein
VLASPETQAHIGSTIERAKSAVAEVPNAIADNLHERAVTQYQQALNPTKERTKYLAQKVAPEMLDRGIVASSPKSLAERAGMKPNGDGTTGSDV